MVKSVIICVPPQMACYQPGAAGSRRHTEILLGTGRDSFDDGFPTEYIPVVCLDFAPEFHPELINRPSDLVNRFKLLCVFIGDTVSSLCVPPGLFDRALSQPVWNIGCLKCSL